MKKITMCFKIEGIIAIRLTGSAARRATLVGNKKAFSTFHLFLYPHFYRCAVFPHPLIPVDIILATFLLRTDQHACF